MRNIAQINIKNLIYNVKSIRNLIGDKVKLCAVVKADAYGHGSVSVSNAIHNLVDYFAVGIVEEGIELRYGGIVKDILVLTPPLKSDIILSLRNNLVMSVCSLYQLKSIYKIAKNENIVARIHIAFNTGMNRFGVDDEKTLVSLLEYAKDKNLLSIEGLYSHFSCPEDEKLRNQAVNKFLLAKKVIKGYNKNIIFHISASGGTLKGEYHDMVRIGIMLYGYLPFCSDNIFLKKVMTIKAPVIKKRDLTIGKSALYGKNISFKKQSIAIVRFGYADGLERRKVNGQFNNRCMDVTAIKINGNKRKVDILSNAQLLAKNYKTIPYEILTKISMRTEKRYKR